MVLNIHWSTQMKNKNNISCKWLQARKVVINPDGQVAPCCYLANTFFYNDYPYDKEEHNVFNRPLEDILENSQWFNKELPESWNSDTPFKQCVDFCAKKGKYFHKLRRIND